MNKIEFYSINSEKILFVLYFPQDAEIDISKYFLLITNLFENYD